jgi:hypothetical protein
MLVPEKRKEQAIKKLGAHHFPEQTIKKGSNSKKRKGGRITTPYPPILLVL